MPNPQLDYGLVNKFNPSVSIIMPTWRRDVKTISRAIDCVILQTIGNWELLICSDGCQEEHVLNLVQSKEDARIRYFHLDGKVDGDYGNRCRQAMLEQANGEFVLFFDDDNLILPRYLEEMTDAIDSASIEELVVDFAVCQVVHFGPLNAMEIGRAPKILNGKPMKLFHIDTLQVVCRTSTMKELGWKQGDGYLADGKTFEALGASRRGVWVNEMLGFHM
jgi:glycosyltransferase involved in cell wall biosynthesis